MPLAVRLLNLDNAAHVALVAAALLAGAAPAVTHFGPIQTMSVPGTLTLSSPLVADLDRDGRDDLAVLATTSSSIWIEQLVVYRGTAGGLVPWARLAVPRGFDSYVNLVTGDFDGDGKGDLLYTYLENYPYAPADRRVVVAFQSGAGFTLAAPQVIADASPFDLGGLAVQDLDLDGRDDLVFSTYVETQTFALYSTGAGDFGRRRVVYQGSKTQSCPPPSPNWPVICSYVGDIPYSAAALSDLDGDGKRDLVVLHASDARLDLFPLEADGSFGAPRTVNLPFTAHGVSVADHDDDGVDDLAVGDSHGVLHRIDFSGVTPTVVALQPIAGSRLGGGWRDVDGDGLRETVATIGAYSWPGGDYHTAVAVGTVGFDIGIASPALMDFDGDGRLDLIGAVSREPTVSGGQGRIVFRLQDLGANAPPVPSTVTEIGPIVSASFDLPATDSDENLLLYQIVTPPMQATSFTVDAHGGRFSYSASPTRSSDVDHFTYQVSDGLAVSAPITVTVHLLPPLPPEPPADPHQGGGGGASGIELLIGLALALAVRRRRGTPTSLAA